VGSVAVLIGMAAATTVKAAFLDGARAHALGQRKLFNAMVLTTDALTLAPNGSGQMALSTHNDRRARERP